MKRYILTPLLFVFCFSLSAQNLLVNGSCDSALVGGEIPGWKELLGTDWQPRTASPLPFSGTGFFFAGAVDVGILGQEVNVSTYASAIDSSIQKFRFIGYARSFDQSPPDDGYIRIRFVKADTTLYTTYNFGPFNDRNNWVKFDTLLNAPVGTRTVAIELKSVRHGNINNDGYFDELSLTPVKVCNAKSFTLTGDTVTCSNDSASICAPQGFSTYQWNEGQDQACIKAVTAGEYYLTALDVNSCPATSDTITLTVHQVSAVSITGADSICAGDTAHICAPDGYTAYIWNKTGEQAACIHAREAGEYYVIANDANGCSIMSDTIDLVVRPNLVPVITFNGNDTICGGDSVQLCATSGYTGYKWNTSVVGDTTLCIYAKSAGIFWVTVTSNAGCKGVSEQFEVNQYPASSVSLSVSRDTLFCNTESTSYQWYANDTAIPGATASFYVATRAASYAVEIIDIYGCILRSSRVAYSDPIGIGRQLLESTTSIYPNPSTGNWLLSVDNSLVGSGLAVYDANGKQVWQSEIRSTTSEIALNVAKGVYWLRITSGGNAITRKLVRL